MKHDKYWFCAYTSDQIGQSKIENQVVECGSELFVRIFDNRQANQNISWYSYNTQDGWYSCSYHRQLKWRPLIFAKIASKQHDASFDLYLS